jgi:arylsulfatase A-like enzyme
VAIAGIAAVASCSGSSSSKALATLPRRPNVVVILLDDLSTVCPFWSAMPKTAALIRDRGLTFTNSFVTLPVCAPSRASLLSGLYAHNNGVLAAPGGSEDYHAFAAAAEPRSLPVRLQGAGYRTAFLGKYLNGYELDPKRIPPGWNEWFGLAGDLRDGYTYEANHNGRMENYGATQADYLTDVLSRRAQSFLNSTRSSRQPFLLYMSPTAPHSWIQPAERDAENKFSRATAPHTPNFNERNISDKPLWLRSGGWKVGGEDAEYRRAMGSLFAVDDMVGAIADKLHALGELDRTVFVFTSDNGLSFGSHRMLGKATPYEESIRVPLAVAGPGIRHGTDKRFVTNLDLAPSLLDLAGVLGPNETDGRSIVPLLRGEKPPWRNDFLIEYRGNYGGFLTRETLADVQAVIHFRGSVDYVPSYRALRTHDWLYAEWYEGEAHEYELYDMKRDPYQLNNLIANAPGAARHASTIAALHARLEALSSCAADSCRN